KGFSRGGPGGPSDFGRGGPGRGDFGRGDFGRGDYGRGDPLDPAQIEADAEMRFRRLDRDLDGGLGADGMDEALQAEKERWDKDGNGVIDLNEYKAYYAALIMARQQENGFGPGIGRDPSDDRRPVIHRAGKLPKDLPPWFAQLDTDNDAQVGLYEW